MFKELRELFVFSRQETIGFRILIVVISLLTGLNLLLPALISPHGVDTSEWEDKVERFNEERVPINQESVPEIKSVVPFKPNEVSVETLVLLGIPEKIALTWSRYVEKGGSIRTKENLLKIYGMTPELAERVVPYLIFPEQSNRRIADTNQENRTAGDSVKRVSTASHRTVERLAKMEWVELNGADSLQLLALPGIGPVLSGRIIKYRKLLGGYYAVDQLKEVYGLKEEHYLNAEPCLFVKKELIRKLNINFSSVGELGRHPYIGFATARKIVAKRDREGRYDSFDQLTSLMSGDSLNRMMPYLDFSHQ